MISKDSLIKGTIILTLAAFTARFLGLFQRVPLKHLLEDTGMATYGIAYNIYYILLIIATAGIPSALSKLISERMALNELGEARRLFKAASLFAIIAGAVMMVVLYVSAPFYAVHIAKVPDSALAIRALAPALLLFPFIAIMRGYFQGRQMMMAGGLSQIVEQFLRVITAVGLAYLILYFGYSHKWAVAGASFGGVTGSIGALAVMLFFWRKLKQADQSTDPLPSSNNRPVPENSLINKSPQEPLSLKQIYFQIFNLSIPISLMSMAVPLVYLIDSSTVIALLDNHISHNAAQLALGILQGRAQSLAGIPPILAIALSMSIVPVISSAYIRSDMEQVNSKASQALRIALLSGLPVVIALAAAARSVNGLLFSDIEGTWIIIFSTICSMFQIMMMTSGAVLLGIGKTRKVVVHVAIGIGVKLAGSFLFASWWGINGIILATALCFMVTMLLNFRELNKTLKITLLERRRNGFIITAIIMAVVGAALQFVTTRYIDFSVPVLNYALQSVVVCGAAGIVYIFFLFFFRIVSNDDVRKLPTPVRKFVSYFIKSKI